jgi:hypothetical protein
MNGRGERSIAEVIGDVVGNVQQIVRAEMRLARAELREDAIRVKRGATLVAAGALVSVLAIGFVLLAAVYGLATVVAPWLAALIVAAAAGVLAAVCVMGGLKSFKDLGLPRTAATLEENIQWAKTRVK